MKHTSNVSNQGAAEAAPSSLRGNLIQLKDGTYWDVDNNVSVNACAIVKRPAPNKQFPSALITRFVLWTIGVACACSVFWMVYSTVMEFHR